MSTSVIHALRTMSARRLAGTCAAVVLGAGSVTAIALAAAGSGPIPPAKGLAVAVHDALAAPAVQGVSARIRFTNSLVDSGAVQGADPLLSGATGRLWSTTGRRFRLELQSDRGDAQIVSDGTHVTVSDPALHQAYRFALPAAKGTESERAMPTVAEIEKQLARVAEHLSVSGAQPSDVAGEPAYTVRLAPRRAGGLIGRAELAWDAVNGVPLRAAIYAVGDDTPVLQLEATDISFGAVPASTFAVAPPSDVKLTEVAAHHGAQARSRGHVKGAGAVTGSAAVAKALPFALSAPYTLAGMPRSGVRLLDVGAKPAALVTYGRGLGGLAVLESAADTHAARIAAPRGRDAAGLSLPAVDIGGAPGQVLPTALGTIVRFSRSGVQYLVAGSVRQPVAEAAARGL